MWAADSRANNRLNKWTWPCVTGPVHCGRLCPSWPSANVRAYHIANCNLWQQILTALCGPVTVLKWPWEVFSVFLFLWDTKGHWCTNVHNKSRMQRTSGTQFIALNSPFFPDFLYIYLNKMHVWRKYSYWYYYIDSNHLPTCWSNSRCSVCCHVLQGIRCWPVI